MVLQSIMLGGRFFLPLLAAVGKSPIPFKIRLGILNIRDSFLIQWGLRSMPRVRWQSMFLSRQSAICFLNLSDRPGLPCTSKVVSVVFSCREWFTRYLKDYSLIRF